MRKEEYTYIIGKMTFVWIFAFSCASINVIYFSHSKDGNVMKERKFFSLFDILIIFIVLAVSVFSFMLVFSRDTDNLTCVVRCDSKEVYSVSLSEITGVCEKTIDSEYPLTIVIENDSVYIKDACCPDKLCEHTGEIHSANQSVVCLPAKVSVTLESGIDSELDAVVG